MKDIADAADVSPRTFSRYFRTKDAVFAAVLDDFAADVAHELRVLPSYLGPFESMRIALKNTLTQAYQTRFYSKAAHRITRAISVITASDALRRVAIEYRGPVMEAMADRMNVTTNDRQLTLAMTVISVTVVHAWTTVAAKHSPEPLLIAKQIDQSFGVMAFFAADLERPDGPNHRQTLTPPI